MFGQSVSETGNKMCQHGSKLIVLGEDGKVLLVVGRGWINKSACQRFGDK